MRSRYGLLAMVAVVGAVACGGSRSHSDVDVIRAWARALSAGDIHKAASYFAVPAIVANGTPPVRVVSRVQEREFNMLLPCGARLVKSARHGRYIYATFLITNRVGGNCGPGVGAIAATAFLIRGGKIAEWRRLPNPGSAPPSPNTPTPSPGQGQGPAV